MMRSDDTLLYVLKSVLADAALLRGHTQRVMRLGLALEPDPRLASWALSERLDAVFLHRTRSAIGGLGLPQEIGVYASHDAFDVFCGLGRGRWFAEEYGLVEEGLLMRDGRPAGRILRAPVPVGEILTRLYDRLGFGERLAIQGGPLNGRLLAAADAMSARLLRDAAETGAEIFLTGSWRSGAVTQEGPPLPVAAFGHRPLEMHGLGLLSSYLLDQCPAIEVQIFEGVPPTGAG